MTRWQHFLAAILPAPTVTVKREKDMTDEQVTRTIQATAPTTPIYRAFMQLLEEAREEAVDWAARDSWSKSAMAMHAGGARYLGAVRADVIRRRGAKVRGAGAPGAPEHLAS